MDLKYVPTQGNFLLVHVKQPGLEVFKQLMQKGIIVRSAEIFGLSQWIRVTIGTPEQNHRLIKGLEEVLVREDSN